MPPPLVITIGSATDLIAVGEAIAAAKTGSDGPIEIQLLGVEFALDSPIVFGSQESGTEETPVTVRGTDAQLSSIDPNNSDPLIRFEDASHLTLAGLKLNGSVQIDRGAGITIESCRFEGFKESAISISAGDRTSLASCRHTVSNCTFQGDDGATGIDVRGVGCRVKNALIENCGQGIVFSGNEHLFRRNRIRNVSTSILTPGGDWTERGNVIRDNWIHHASAAGVVFADLASGNVVSGNLIHDCATGVVVEGGRNHRVTNNVFAHCHPAVRVDGRGEVEGKLPDHVSGDMKHRFESRSPLEPPYAIRYPDLREVAAYYLHELGIPPEGNLINRNICIGDWIETVDPVKMGTLAAQNNVTDGDPGFADAAERDFTLAESAEVYELGFRPVRYEDTGPNADR